MIRGFATANQRFAYNRLGYKSNQGTAKSLLERGFRETSAEPVKSGLSKGVFFSTLQPVDNTFEFRRAKNFLHGIRSNWCKIQVLL